MIAKAASLFSGSIFSSLLATQADLPPVAMGTLVLASIGLVSLGVRQWCELERQNRIERKEREERHREEVAQLKEEIKKAYELYRDEQEKRFVAEIKYNDSLRLG